MIIGPLVTILVPNYKTPELTKLCLRLLRKYTRDDKAKVIVIDNDSQDESLAYLRSLSWIELIERKGVAGEPPVLAHSSALDMALERVATPYVLSIHTDTLVKSTEWLDFLLNQIKKRPTIAGIGSWKLESKPLWRRVLKAIERYTQLAYYTIKRDGHHPLEGVGKNYYYLRSHCALYRMDLIRQFHLTFSQGDMVAGKGMHKSLIEAGFEMVFLPNDILIKYVDHVNHATTVLNPHLSKHESSVRKGLKRIKRSLASVNAENILEDAALDV